jgi:molybdate transport system substrate-binding protein
MPIRRKGTSLERCKGEGTMTILRRTAALVAISALAAVSAAHAAELKALSGNGARAAVRELVSQFERASGHKVALRFEVNAELKRKIEAGETFDVAILNPPVIEDLMKHGKIVAGTRADIGRAGLGVAVRAGAPKPDIGSVEAFKRALLAANAVAYPGEGASGVYFAKLTERLGIAAEMKPKMRPMPAEDAVEVVARGDAEMVVVVSSRIYDVEGVDPVGPLPDELQTMIGFAAALGAAAKEPDAAKELIRFLSAPEAAPILRAKGVTPAR